MGPQWFCIIVEAGCQRQIRAVLADKGYRVFIPMVKRWRSHARVMTAVEQPLLGRYVFVEVDYPRQSFGPITATAGVEALILASGEPWPVKRSDVDDLMHRYLAGEFDEIKNGPLPVGARVAIVAGKFENWLATVTKAGDRRATVKLKGTRQHVNDISLKSLRPAFGSDLQRSNPDDVPV